MDKECHVPFQWTNSAAPVKPSAIGAAPYLLTRTKMINLKCLLLWLAVHLLVLSLHSFFSPSKTPFYPDSSLSNSPSELSKRLSFQSLVLAAQSYPTLCEPRDCSPPGSFVPTQGSNLGLLHCRQTLYHLSHQGSPLVLSNTSEKAELFICRLCFFFFFSWQYTYKSTL